MNGTESDAPRLPFLLQDGTTTGATAPGKSGRFRVANGQQFHLKDEIGVGRNGSGSAFGTVAVIGGDVQLGLFAQRHHDDTFVPALNDLSNANHELKGGAAGDAAVELLPAVRQGSRVVHRQAVALFGKGGSVSRRDNVFGDSHSIVAANVVTCCVYWYYGSYGSVGLLDP